ncbi:DUF4007 family protein [Planococcus maritimus]|uniref:DUF4007 family protein n=1 Tax=Planococcus maritimus TaxID=192421 RepID=A0A7D7QV77_PLAMR|nr:DUF4007 family protein [Planococcus maritimus]QMT17214.1 DUF4007 family protein [Planococcus maritimus]
MKEGILMGYSQHQSFYLRDRWLSKAMKNIEENSSFFYEKDAFEKIGLGKNMVQSLKHWIVATKLYEEVKENNKKHHEITPLGKFIKEKDRAIKYFNSAGLLHHSLATNKEVSTTWYWFFNIYTETVFSREEVFEELTKWVQKREKRVVSENSLKRDLDCLIKIYTTGGSTSDPEEVILSPLNKLNVLEERNGTIYKKEVKMDEDNLLLVGYTLLKFCETHGASAINLDDIVHKENLLGKLFNMRRSSIVNLISEWTEHPQYPVVFTRTNNLDTLRLPDVSPEDFINYEYNRKAEKNYGN